MAHILNEFRRLTHLEGDGQVCYRRSAWRRLLGMGARAKGSSHLEFTSLLYLNLWFCDFKNVGCFLSFWDGNMLEEIVLGTSQVKA